MVSNESKFKKLATKFKLKLKLSLVILLIFLIIDIELTCAQTRTTTTTTSSSTSTGELFLAPNGNKSEQVHKNHRQSRIIHLKAAPFNGRLSLFDPNSNSNSNLNSDLSTLNSDLNVGSFGSRQPKLLMNENDDNKQSQVSASSPMLVLRPSTSLSSNRKVAISTKGESDKIVTEPKDAHGRLLVSESNESRQNIKQQASSTSNQDDLTSTTTTSDFELQSQQQTQNEGSILGLIDEFDSQIVTNRTKAQLSCDSGEMIIRLNFSEPFKGIVYPDYNRLSPCRFFGDGHHNYELRLPLRGCGTRQVAPRVFVNDVIVRFHKSLELEEDEVKTLICRYPPPLTFPNITNNNLSNTNISNSSSLSHFDLQPDQIEFIDTKSLPNNRVITGIGGGGGSSGNIDTLSDNIIISPGSNGIQQSWPPPSSGGGILPPTGVRNSQLMDRPPGSSTIGSPNLSSQDSNGRSNFIQRHRTIQDRNNNLMRPIGQMPNSTSSGLELLLLISSLMFLVLLALALATGLYCIQRRRRRFPDPSSDSNNAATSYIKSRYKLSNSNDSRISDQQRIGSPYRLPITYAHMNAHHGHTHRRELPVNDITSSSHWLGARHMEPSKVTGRRAINKLVNTNTNTKQSNDQNSSSDADGSSWLPDQVFSKASLPRWAPEYRLPDAQLHNGPRGRYGMDNLTRYPMSPIRIEQNWQTQTLDQNGDLWRAKSLTSDRRRALNGNRGRRVPMVTGDINSVAFGSFVGESTDKVTSKHSLNPAWTSQDITSRVSFAMPSRWKAKHGDSREPVSASSSEREIDETEPDSIQDRAAILGRRQATGRRPRLVVQRIEDAYITRFSEIESQDWRMRDNREPLSLRDWRAMQPNMSSKRRDGNEDNQGKVVSDEEGEGEEDIGDSPSSILGNLRSLSEIDVSFARQDGTTTKGDKSTEETVTTNNQFRANSDNTKTVDTSKEKAIKGAEYERIESPDLIISPEYDVDDGSFDRLRDLSSKIKLRQEQRKPTSPDNSVSYV